MSKVIIIGILFMVIFGTICAYGINAMIEEEKSKECQQGRDLIKDGSLIGCEHIDGYISDPISAEPVNVFEDLCFILGLIGVFVSLIITGSICTDY